MYRYIIKVMYIKKQNDLKFRTEEDQTTKGAMLVLVLGVMRYHVIRYRPRPAATWILKPAGMDGLRKVRFILGRPVLSLLRLHGGDQDVQLT